MPKDGYIDLNTYYQAIKDDAEAVKNLSLYVLIGVTRLFRDPEAWEIFEEYLRALIDKKLRDDPSATVRIWSAGCGSGEEAYTLALIAHRLVADRCEFTIFASDINPTAIASAREGVFPNHSLIQLPHALVADHIIKASDGYFRFKPAIRKRIVFAQHNLAKDPFFPTCDAICCRNVLIYLQLATQRAIRHRFWNSLNIGGLLLLGGSESIGSTPDPWLHLDKRWRLYAKQSMEPSGISSTDQQTVMDYKKARQLGESLRYSEQILRIRNQHPKSQNASPLDAMRAVMSLDDHSHYELILNEISELAEHSCLVVDLASGCLIHCVGRSPLVGLPRGPMTNVLSDLLVSVAQTAVLDGLQSLREQTDESGESRENVPAITIEQLPLSNAIWDVSMLRSRAINDAELALIIAQPHISVTASDAGSVDLDPHQRDLIDQGRAAKWTIEEANCGT